MPTKIEVGGHLATVHATLDDPQRVGTDGETTVVIVGNFNEMFDRGDADRDPEELRAALQRELTDQARRVLEPDASVEVKWSRGSLEVAAVISVGKAVVDVVELLGGIQQLRDLIPARIRERVGAWLGRDVALTGSHVEAGADLLRATAPADKESNEKEPGDAGFSVDQLWRIAGLALTVLLLTTAAVVAGVAILTNVS